DQAARGEQQHRDAIYESFGEDDWRGARQGRAISADDFAQPVALGYLAGLAWGEPHREARKEDQRAFDLADTADVEHAQVVIPAQPPEGVIPDSQQHHGHNEQ